MSKGNEPVHPVSSSADFQAHGLNKREYFAGLAMQAIISGTCANNDAIAASTKLAEEAKLSDYEYFAIHATQYADALLAELERTNDQ